MSRFYKTGSWVRWSLAALLGAGALFVAGCSDSQAPNASTLPGKSPSSSAAAATSTDKDKDNDTAQAPVRPADKTDEKPSDSPTTYANPKYGFVIDMPAGWQFGEETPDAAQVSVNGPAGEEGLVWGQDNAQHLADGAAVCGAEKTKNDNKSFQVASEESDQGHCLLKLVNKAGKKARLLSIYVGPAFINTLQVDYPADVAASSRDVTALEASFLPGGLNPR